MECKVVREILEDSIDGRLSAADGDAVRRHLGSCAECASEDAGLRLVGGELRRLAAAKTLEKSPELDAMWTRVRAGIAERRAARAAWRSVWRWAWFPAAALLAVLALLFYPSGVNRAPFHPSSFDVSVENVESDAGTVAVLDRGEDYPRVIWIIEDEKT
jgi:anti-sigma factor RsiW